MKVITPILVVLAAALSGCGGCNSPAAPDVGSPPRVCQRHGGVRQVVRAADDYGEITDIVCRDGYYLGPR